MITEHEKERDKQKLNRHSMLVGEEELKKINEEWLQHLGCFSS